MAEQCARAVRQRVAICNSDFAGRGGVPWIASVEPQLRVSERRALDVNGCPAIAENASAMRHTALLRRDFVGSWAEETRVDVERAYREESAHTPHTR